MTPTSSEKSTAWKIDRALELMNERLPRLVITVLMLLLGMGVTYYILTSDRNPVAEMMFLLGGLSLLVSMIQPRVGFYILMVACCYLDLTKRVAYWFGYYSAANQGVATLQMNILSFAPMTMVGIFLGVIIRRIFVTKRLIESHEWLVVVFVMASIAMILKSAYGIEHDIVGAISKGANEGVYLLMLFVVPALFSTREDIVGILRFVFFVFLPCALYGIWQGIYGYTALDTMWMDSGITVTGSLIYDLKARAFGTMASPHPYSIIYWIIIFGGYLIYTTKRGRSLYVIGTLIYMLALFYGYGRGAWVSLVVTLGAFYFFSTVRKTLFFYGVSIAVFLGFVFYAQYLLDHIGDFESVLPINSASAEMSFRLGTFSERLFSIQNWTSDSRLWSWFGKRDMLNSALGYDEIVHELLGQVLVRYGGVGLIGCVLIASTSLGYFHWSTFQIRDRRNRMLAILFLGTISVTFICNCLAGSSYEVFPWNVFIWMLVGCQIVLCRDMLREEPAERPEPEPEAEELGGMFSRQSAFMPLEPPRNASSQSVSGPRRSGKAGPRNL